jgi:hypothetical protein
MGMRRFYNTNDHIYIEEDIKQAFTHALNLGRSGWGGSVDRALMEWKDEYEENTRREITLKAILDTVVSVTGTSEYHILVDVRRYKPFVEARHLICWFAFFYTTETTPIIRDFLGYKNHSSVIYSRDYIDGQLQYNKQIRLTVDTIKSRLSYDGYLVRMARRKSQSEYIMETV